MAFLGLFGPPNVDKLAARRDVGGLIRALAYEKDAFVRLLAARALGHIGDARAIAPLVTALTDGAFSATRADYALAHQIKVARNDTHKTVSAEAVTALEHVDRDWGTSECAKAAVPELIGVLRNTPRLWLRDYNYGVHWAAIVALGKIRDASAVEPLVEWLTKLPEGLASYAADALYEIGDRRAVAPLISALIYGDYLLYKSAIRALDKIDPTWSKSEAAKAAVPSFLVALKDSDLATSWAAGEALNMIGVKRGV